MDIQLIDPANRSNPDAEAAQNAQKYSNDLDLIASVSVSKRLSSTKTVDLKIDNRHIVDDASNSSNSKMLNIINESNNEEKNTTPIH